MKQRIGSYSGRFARRALWLLGAIVAPSGMAEDPAPQNTQNATTPGAIEMPLSPVPPIELFGMVYTSAQWAPLSGDMDAWNLARAGVRISKNFNVSYNQILLNDYRTKKQAGFNFRIDDGFVRTKWNRIAGNDRVNLGYEQHYTLPISELSQKKTMVGAFRNRLFLNADLTSWFRLTVEESPTLFWFRQPGLVGPTGAGSANEQFRNFFVVTPTISAMNKKLTVYLPLWVQNSRFHTFAQDALKSSAWRHSVIFWPEITYLVHPKVELGLTAMTGSLVTSDFSKTSFDKAFQTVLTAFEVYLYL